MKIESAESLKLILSGMALWLSRTLAMKLLVGKSYLISNLLSLMVWLIVTFLRLALWVSPSQALRLYLPASIRAVSWVTYKDGRSRMVLEQTALKLRDSS